MPKIVPIFSKFGGTLKSKKVYVKMARRYRRRFSRRYRPSYTVQRKVLQSQAWDVNPGDPQNRLTSLTLIENVSDGGNNTINAGNKTVKHIEVQVLSRPGFQVSTQYQGQYNYVWPATVWAAIYVPEGTSINPFFAGGSVAQTTLYEPAQFVLGSGVIAGTSSAYVNENVAGEEAEFNGIVATGNTTRIRVPLSKRLNPGDKVVMVFGTVDMAYGDLQVREFRPMRLLVKYAIKYN